MSLAEYHALDAIGNGRISDFLKSVSKYRARHILPPNDPNHLPDDDTSATRGGSGFHALILDGVDVYEKNFRQWGGGLTKDGEATTSRNSADYKKWAADCKRDGVTEITKGQHEAFQNMAAAIWEHEDARELLHGDAPATNEETLLFEQLGMQCKARPDRRIHAPASILVDLKTTSGMDLDEIQRDAIKNGYHRQAVWYSRAHESVFGVAPRDFVFVSVRSARPWDVWCWRLTAAMEDLANAQIDRALAGILGRRESGNWIPDHCRGIHYLPDLKPWQMEREETL